MVPHWPRPWGLGADPIHQLIIDEEFRTAGVRRPSNPIGLGWAGPTLIEAGTDEKVKQLLANYMIVGPLSFEATNARFKRDTEIMLAVLKEIGLKPE